MVNCSMMKVKLDVREREIHVVMYTDIVKCKFAILKE